ISRDRRPTATAPACRGGWRLHEHCGQGRRSGGPSVITLGKSASSFRMSSGNGYGRSRTLHASKVQRPPSHQPTKTNQNVRVRFSNGRSRRSTHPGGALSRTRSANGFFRSSAPWSFLWRDSSLSAPGGRCPRVERKIPKRYARLASGVPTNVSWATYPMRKTGNGRNVPKLLNQMYAPQLRADSP